MTRAGTSADLGRSTADRTVFTEPNTIRDKLDPWPVQVSP